MCKARFDWDRIEHEPGNYELKMMAFLCFKVEVSVWDWTRTLAFLT